MFDFQDYSKKAAISFRYDNSKYNCAYIKIAAPKTVDPQTGRVKSFDWDKAPNYTLDAKELTLFAREVIQVLSGQMTNTPVHQYTNGERQLIGAMTNGSFVVAMLVDGNKHDFEFDVNTPKFQEFVYAMRMLSMTKDPVTLSDLKFMYDAVCNHINYSMAVGNKGAKNTGGATEQKSGSVGNLLDTMGGSKPSGAVEAASQDILSSFPQSTPPTSGNKPANLTGLI